MDKIRLIKRPGGVEDLAFDVTGNNVKDKYFSNNRMIEVKRINSSHIPVDRSIAEMYSKTKGSVSEILKDIRMKISDINENINDIASLTEDRKVIFPQNTVTSEKQNFINLENRNLGGYTLTFEYPESIDITQDDVLDFSGFYNGRLIIDGRDIVINDMADIGNLYRFNDCHCNVVVRNITISHKFSKYGVVAYRSPSINFENVLFIGLLPGSTAVLFYNSDGVFTNCSFKNDIQSEYKSSEYENIKELLNEMLLKFNSLDKKTQTTSRHLFDTWFSLSSAVPDGAVILNGDLIENVDVKYPEFWKACVKNKADGTIVCCTEQEWHDEVNIRYQFTKDKNFIKGKLYYSKSGDVYKIIKFTPGTTVPLNTYYEKVGFGQTGKFVIDEALKTVRIPKITRFISGCSDQKDFAQGSYDQVTNVVSEFGGSRHFNIPAKNYPVPFDAERDDSNTGYYNSHDTGYNKVTWKMDWSTAVRTGEEVQPINVHLWAFMQVK